MKVFIWRWNCNCKSTCFVLFPIFMMICTRFGPIGRCVTLQAIRTTNKQHTCKLFCNERKKMTVRKESKKYFNGWRSNMEVAVLEHLETDTKNIFVLQKRKQQRKPRLNSFIFNALRNFRKIKLNWNVQTFEI